MIMAALTLRNARRNIEVAEYHIEYLRREQSRLLALLREERRTFQEQMEREREHHLLEVRLHEERSSQELSLSLREQEKLAEEARQEWEQHLVESRRLYELSKRELSASQREQERLSEKVRHEREQHREAQQRARQESAKHREAQQRAQREREGRERERSARLETEERIEQLEREIRRLQETQRESATHQSVTRESATLVPSGPPETRTEARTEARVEPREPPKRRPSSARGARGGGAPKPPASPAGETSKPVRSAPRDEKPGRGVWHPHPDDDVGVKGGDMPEKRDREAVGAPVEMYRKHYDKYLENYRGYVELAEELYRTRGEVADGAFGERELEERLRRILDGIERTTARLDILEQHNPELVTDARISHRASVARRHEQLS